MTNFISPLGDWQHEHMAFELAALHGELYRIFQCQQDEEFGECDETLSARIGTGGDRMVNACFLIAVAALPALEDIVRCFNDTEEPGVFTYNHVELGDVKAWRTRPQALPAYLWFNLPEAVWLEAAENNVVDLDVLNPLIEFWGQKYVNGYRAKGGSGVVLVGPQTHDMDLSPEQLMERYSPDDEGEHPRWPRQLWRQAVVEMDTTSGYWVWVKHQLTSPQYDPAQCNKVLFTRFGKRADRNVVLTQVCPGEFSVSYGDQRVNGLDGDSVGKVLGDRLFHSLVSDGGVDLV